MINQTTNTGKHQCTMVLRATKDTAAGEIRHYEVSITGDPHKMPILVGIAHKNLHLMAPDLVDNGPITAQTTDRAVCRDHDPREGTDDDF